MANYSLIYKLISDDKQFRSGFDRASKALKNHKTAMDRNGFAARDVSKHLRLLQDRAKMAGMTFGTQSKQFKKATLSAKAYRIEMEKVNKAMAKGGATGGRGVGGGSKMGSIAGVAMNRVMPLMAIGGVSQLITSVARDLVDYEKTMSQVEAITGATNEDMVEFDKAAKMISSSLPRTASEVAKLQVELSKLGFSADQVLFSIEPITKLSVATMSDMGETATLVASTLNAFSLEASRSAEVADILAYSVSNSALDLQKLATGLPNVAKGAKEFGWSLQKTTGLLGILADNGIDASKMGTDLRMIITQLASKGLTLNDALKTINKSTNKITTAQEMFGQRAYLSAIALANQADEVNNLDEESKEYIGTAGEMARVMQDNVAGAIDRMTSAWGTFIKTVSSGDGVLQGFIEQLARVINEANVLLGGLDAGRVGIEKDIFSSESRTEAIAAAGGVWKEGEKNVNVLKEQLKLIKAQAGEYGRAHKAMKELVDEGVDGIIWDGFKPVSKQKIAESREEDLRHQSEALNQLVRELQAKIDEKPVEVPVVIGGGGSGSGSGKYKAKFIGIIQELKNGISDAKKKMNRAVDPSDAMFWSKTADNLQKQLDILMGAIDFKPLEPELTVKPREVKFIEPDGNAIGSIEEVFAPFLSDGLTTLADTAMDDFFIAMDDFLLKGEQADWSQFGSGILSGMGSFIESFGKMLVTQGTLLIAAKALQAMGVLAAPAAIAIGLAAMAVGKSMQMKNSEEGLTGSSGGGGISIPSVSTPSGYSEYSTSYGVGSGGDVDRAGSGIQVTGTLKAKGSDLIAVIDNQERRNSNFR